MSSQENLVILGVDPGLASTGWGVIKKLKVKSEKLKMKDGWGAIKYGVIRTKAGEVREERLQKIYDELQKLIKKYQPDLMAIEEVFFGKNAKTAMMVGQAQGVAVLAAVNLGKAIETFTPLQVKNAIVGYGRAEKRQVQVMVQKQLEMSKIPKPDDAADGLAVALTAAVTQNQYDRQT